MKKKKKTLGDIIFHTCTPNYGHMMYGSWDKVHNGWLDRWMEKVTYKGGCPT